jgi:PKD repeat protein
MRVFSIIFFEFLFFSSLSQSLQADFSIPSQACLQEGIDLSNLSTGAISYEWDFCSGDLEFTPTSSVLVDSYGGYGTRVKMIEQNGNHYGFFIGRAAKRLFRLNFGSNIKSQPTITDLGDLGLNSSTLRAIEIVKDGNDFFGFVVDSEKSGLYRFELGSSVANNPFNITVLYSNQELNSPMELTVVSDGVERFLFVVNSNNRKLVRFELDESFGGPVLNVYPLDTSVGQWLNAVSFLKEGTTWYGVAVDPVYYEVVKLKFNDGLSDTNPSITIIPIQAPVGISLVSENGLYFAFVQSQNSTSSIFRINLGGSLDNNPLSIDDLNELGLPAWGYSMYKTESTWVAFTTNAAGPNIYRLIFPNNCLSLTEFSNEFEPYITTTNSGLYSIALTVKDSFGNTDTKSRSISVSNQESPDIDFNSLFSCVNHDLFFNSFNVSNDISNYSWSFGDTQTSTDPNPTHQYSSAGDYTVSLQVTAENGCNNYIEKTISIYDEPIPDFQIPVTNPLCTNQNYIFENTSTTDPDYPVTWQWKVNGVDEATTEDLNYTFTQADNQSVTLTASIPGCENTVTKPISTLTEGPLVDFAVPAVRCEDDALQFTNATQGSVSGYTWNFGDGNSSTDVHGTNAFAEPGVYPLTLTATNAAGCVNYTTRNVQVFSKPVVDFSFANPCNGQATSFTNGTAPPTDSNLAFWQWEFGDNTGASFSENAEHAFANAGDYNVSFSVTTGEGCMNSAQKLVTINTTPIPDFTHTPSCVNKEITFTGTSTGTITFWDWQVGNTPFGGATLTEVKRTFSGAGTYPATLTVRGSNSCYGQVMKQIDVPPALLPDFSFTKNCVNQETEFTDITNHAADPAVLYAWNAGSAGTATGESAVFTFPTTGSKSVALKITTQTGCEYTVVKPVSVLPAVLASFTPSREIGGPPLEVKFTNTSGANATSFLWTFGDAAQTTSTLASPTFTYTELGEYEAKLTAYTAQNCVSFAQQTITVVVPVIDVMLTNLELQQLAAGSIKPKVTIVNNGNIPLTNVSLLLDVGGVTVREFVNSSIPAGGSLQHTVRFELPSSQGVEYFCAEAEVEDVSVLDNKVCLTLENILTTLTPYPNPTSDIISAEWISNDGGNVTLTLVNAMGREVKKLKVQSQPGFNSRVIDTAGMSPGIYLVRIQHRGLSKVYRVVVQK